MCQRAATFRGGSLGVPGGVQRGEPHMNSRTLVFRARNTRHAATLILGRGDPLGGSGDPLGQPLGQPPDWNPVPTPTAYPPPWASVLTISGWGQGVHQRRWRLITPRGPTFFWLSSQFLAQRGVRVRPIGDIGDRRCPCRLLICGLTMICSAMWVYTSLPKHPHHQL